MAIDFVRGLGFSIITITVRQLQQVVIASPANVNGIVPLSWPFAYWCVQSILMVWFPQAIVPSGEIDGGPIGRLNTAPCEACI